MRWPWRSAGVLCGVLFAVTLHASDESVDPDFLEFLGSVDSNDIGWHDYLAATDVDAVAQRGVTKGADPNPPGPANETGKVQPP